MLRSTVGGAPSFYFLAAVCKSCANKGVANETFPPSPSFGQFAEQSRLQLKKKGILSIDKITRYCGQQCRLTRLSQPVRGWTGHGLCQPLAKEAPLYCFVVSGCFRGRIFNLLIYQMLDTMCDTGMLSVFTFSRRLITIC